MSLTILGMQITVPKLITALISLFVFFFDPNQAKLMLALLSLMAFDTIAGTIYSYKMNIHKNEIFWKLAISKFLKYFGAVAAAHVLEYFLVGLPYMQDLDTYVLSFLALTEAKSFYTFLVKFGIKIPLLAKINKLFEEEVVDKA